MRYPRMAHTSNNIVLILFCVFVNGFAVPSFSNFMVQAEAPVTFGFPSFDSNDQNITFEGEAYVAEKVIQLTRNAAGVSLGYSAGRVHLANPIPLWYNSSTQIRLSSFNTCFEFMIGSVDVNVKKSQYNFGDGLAFFMAPFNQKITRNSADGRLGLFNASNNGNLSNQIVAVEFDTYPLNDWDPSDKSHMHVGIDVNSISSKVVHNVSNKDLTQRPVTARIEYDGPEKKLQVFLLHINSSSSIMQGKPILSYGIDLSEFLPPTIMVGFSSGTGGITAINSVISWKFSIVSSCFHSPASDCAGRSCPRKGLHKRKSRTNEIQIIVPVFLTASIFCFWACFFAHRWYVIKRKMVAESAGSCNIDMAMDAECSAQTLRKFTHAELSFATKNFSEGEKLGEGGFGGVYRGILPETNEVVAVKHVSHGSIQGKKEYISEVSIISRLRHRNLVQLLGWCHEILGEWLLVYEYMPNGSLDRHLFGNQKNVLDWDCRYRIAGGLASALLYLHEECEQCVVHRDVKSTNVMLDSHFTAKLGDFGLARLVEHDRLPQTTVVAGTFGYLAPECVWTGKATAQSDVFSFGTVCLEIACGKPAVNRNLEKEKTRLVDWVWNLYAEGRILDAADERLGGQFDAEELKRLTVVGLACSHVDPTARPTMRKVLKILNCEEPTPHIPSTAPIPLYAPL